MIAACGQRGGSGESFASTVSSRAPTSAQAPTGTAAAAASTAPSAAPPASAAPSAREIPPRVPDSERPSAKMTPPAGVKSAEWKKVFETYGTLLDLDPILDDRHRDHPEITEIVELATTHEGRPVKAMVIADKPSRACHVEGGRDKAPPRGRPSVLLNGAHHGDEALSASIALDAINTLLAGAKDDARVKRYLAELCIWVVPMVNRDGFAAFLGDLAAGRKNGRETRKDRSPMKARGVDLNRNYPFRWGSTGEVGSSKNPNRRSYRGAEPMSEPETKAMVDLSDREHFVGSISYHVGTVALLAPYTIENVPVPVPNEAWIVAEDVAKGMPKIDTRPVVVRKNLYAVDGTDQDYHRFAHGTLALLLESAAKSWDSPTLAKKAIGLIRPSWMRLFDRYLDGPSVEGHVTDEAGRAVSARVEIAEIRTRAGEEWRSRCSDGFYGRYLPSFGKFTVRVTPPSGGAVIEKSVDVSADRGRATVDVVIPGSAEPACPEPKRN
jgi:hypothetical protein